MVAIGNTKPANMYYEVARTIRTKICDHFDWQGYMQYRNLGWTYS